MTNMPPWFWYTIAFVFGISIGSFLNVVIWRLPRNESLANPPSHCPSCGARLHAIDLFPLLSFLILGCRCRHCKAPIAWRYFYVELLTGLLFLAIAWRFLGDPATCVALLLLTSVLIAVYFIDLATFYIPNSLNLLALLIALGRDLWGLIQHEPGHVLLFGWLPGSVLGAAVGVVAFGSVRVIGWIWKRQEAMGLGDPLLARALGAMLVSVTAPRYFPLRLFPAWILFSCLSGVIAGPALIFLRSRSQQPKNHAGQQDSSVEARKEHRISGDARDESIREESIEEEPESSLGQQLLEVGWCLWLGDAVEYLRDVIRWLRREPALATLQVEEEEEEFIPAPTAIPFGPFLVIGFLAAVFFGEALTAWYVAFAMGNRLDSP